MQHVSCVASTHLEEYGIWKPYGASPFFFVLLFDIFPSVSSERLSVSCVNLLEYLVHMCSHYFIITPVPSSFCAGYVFKVELHWVIAQLVD